MNLFTSIGNVGPITSGPGGTDTSFEIVIPVGAPTYVLVLNPPFIPYESTTGNADGAFQLNAL
ncbi:MAG: hypothetical protein P8R42_05560 [Candidatus Binatia bacterium]|nr:hypothetical protein [Candidatus Binatia bacterium]